MRRNTKDRSAEEGHREQFSPSKVRLVSLVSFLFGLTDAVLAYVVSLYFQEIAGTENVSGFYLAIFSAVLFLLFFFHGFVRRLGGSGLLSVLLALLVASSASLILVPTSWWSVAVLVVHLVLVNLIWVNLDVILESFSSDSRSGRIRGLYLTILNAGFLAAPFAVTRTLDRFGFEGLFLAELFLSCMVFLVALLGLGRVNRRFKERISPWQVFEKVRGRPDILRIYHVSSALEFFYAVMIVYVPIRMLGLGMPWSDIGVAFTVMLLPFVILQYPLGRLADKDWGEKEMLIVSLLVMGVSSGLVAFVDSSSVWAWSAALFATRVGVAAVEVLRDSYFYKRIDGSDVDVIAFFRTSRPAANIAAAAVCGVALFFLPVQAVFGLVALNTFVSLYSAVTLRDNLSENEREERAFPFDRRAGTGV
jgi:MFS family permease